MEKTDFSLELGEVDLLIHEIWGIKNSPEGKRIFDEIRKRQIAVGKIFRNNPQIRTTYRFQKLMEIIENGLHFGHYAKAISRAEWIGRIRKANEAETTIIIDCFREKKRLPFLTIGFRRIWYVPSNPENKSDQAMVLALKSLYYRAKKQREDENSLDN